MLDKLILIVCEALVISLYNAITAFEVSTEEQAVFVDQYISSLSIA